MTDNPNEQASEDGKDVLNIHHEGALVVLELCRPNQLNALSLPLMEQLYRTLKALPQDRSARALALTGAGRAFCAGADIKTFGPMADDPDGLREYFDAFADTVQTLADLPLPTVAGIQGGCHGGGISLAIACDLRIADSTARFSLPPARLGLHYGAADMSRLVRAVGHATAVDLLIGARQLDAEQAHRHRLVQHLCDTGRAAEKAREAASRLSGLSLASIASSKRFLNRMTCTQADHPHFTDSPEIAEGIRAFSARKAATFAWHPADGPVAE